MKKKVRFSIAVYIMTSVFSALMAGIVVYFAWRGDYVVLVPLCCCLAALFVCALAYSPVAVETTRSMLCIRRTFRTKYIMFLEIESVKLCPPTMGERRICASGGFFGYWGWFSERDLGRYFAYYGKASDCFLVTLRSGRKYMLGCEDAPEMVKQVQAGIEEWAQ